MFGRDESMAVMRQTFDRIPLPAKMLVDMELASEILHPVEASRTQEDLVLGALAVDLEQFAGIERVHLAQDP